MVSGAAERLLQDPAFPALKAWIIGRTGLAYWSDKDGPLAERLHRLTGGASCEQYLRTLRRDEAAVQALLAEVTVGETYFFRAPEQLRLLCEIVLPRCLAETPDHPPRVWSAGCSNGAEPYSLAILCTDTPEFSGLRILATDISPHQLAAARRAEYGEWSLRGVPVEMRHQCFDRAGTRWLLRPEFRAAVDFRLHNLITDDPPPGAPFDLVLCRNVLIYFSPVMRRQVLELLWRSLRPGGWLLLGHGEGVAEVTGLFVTVRHGDVTLQRKPSGAVPPPPPPKPPPHRPPPPRPVCADTPRPDLRALADAGDWHGVLDAAAERIGEAPTDPLPHYYQGLAQAHLGSADAASGYRRAVYLDRSFALAHFQLGRLSFDAGKRPEAARHFRNVVTVTEGLKADDPVTAGGVLTAGELRTVALLWLTKLDKE